MFLYLFSLWCSMLECSFLSFEDQKAPATLKAMDGIPCNFYISLITLFKVPSTLHKHVFLKCLFQTQFKFWLIDQHPPFISLINVYKKELLFFFFFWNLENRVYASAFSDIPVTVSGGARPDRSEPFPEVFKDLHELLGEAGNWGDYVLADSRPWWLPQGHALSLSISASPPPLEKILQAQFLQETFPVFTAVEGF